jgi:hypothetical protein
MLSDAFCPAAMTGTHTVSENPLPAKPTVTAASRCGAGTVTLRASSTGAVIDWYATSSGGTAFRSGNNTYTTPSLSASTTYYTQARIAATGCVSAARTAVVATVKTALTISRSGGAASQTINLKETLKAIVYTASDAATISRTDGSFPTGVTGTASGSSFTISGAPSLAGTFSYSLTAATNVNGCASTSTAGIITVQAGTFSTSSTSGPNTAYTTKTWMIGTGSSAQTWSDRIVSPTCTKVSAIPTFGGSYYSEVDGHFYYAHGCIMNNQTTLCPTPWRIPNRVDFDRLAASLGGRTTPAIQRLNAEWGTGGLHSNGAVSNANISVWALLTSESANKLTAFTLTSAFSVDSNYATAASGTGLQLRCVK